MRRYTSGVLFSLAYSSVIPRAAAFSEDLCVETLDTDRTPQGDGPADPATLAIPAQGDGETRRIVNCLTAEVCDPNKGGDTSLCRANLMLDAVYATEEAGRGAARSMVHVDAVHFIAQAVGLEPQAAYWLAAYDESTDVEQYIPFGMTGEVVEREDDGSLTRTPLLNGWARFSAVTGGISYHFVAPYTSDPATFSPSCDTETHETNVCGLYPDLTDPIHEGMLVHLRAWAFEDRDACTDGLTTPDETGNPFLGDACYMTDPLLKIAPALVEPYIMGFVPTLTALDGAPVPYEAFSGRQIAHYDNFGYTPYPRNIRYADGLEHILIEFYGLELPAILGDHTLKDQVALVRMGIFLHALQDRISHWQCGDASYVTGPDDEQHFNYVYDQELCTQDLHAYGHYLEIGQEALPERTASALEYTYDELAAFGQAWPQWQCEQPPPLDDAYRARVVGDLLEVLKIPEACERLRQMILLVDRYGFQQMPGNSAEATPYMCVATGETAHEGAGRSTGSPRMSWTYNILTRTYAAASSGVANTNPRKPVSR